MFNKTDRNLLKEIHDNYSNQKEKEKGFASLLEEYRHKASVDSIQQSLEYLKSENKELLNIINQIINLTYESPNSAFETVVFQRYKQKPVIFYKGKKMDLDNADNVTVTFDQSCVPNVYETEIGVLNN